MNGNQFRPALVESLEPRQLLSAGLHPKAHPAPLPSLVGSFIGRATVSGGAPILLSLNIASQKGGAVAGSALEGDGSIGQLKGSINRKGIVHLTLRGTSSKFSTNCVGTLAGSTLNGTLATTAGKHHHSGAFSTAKLADSSAVASGPVLNTANGHFYYLLQPSTWTDAQAAAQTLGGNLVTINDAAEQTWVYSNFATSAGVGRNLWIGYYDPTQDALTGPAHAANFVWIDGTAPGYTNWNTGEPNNFNHGQFYVYIMAPHWNTNGLWDDNEGTALVDHFGASSQGVVEIAP